MIRGRFLLSVNDCAATREIFGRFELRRAAVNYSIAATTATPSGELIVTN